ncbi:annexin A7 [Drosophila kikkawai]|uniref:Annexin A7 n=1 Tax=Drosophila kikkawai TaxID=30033 RepID=A0A6P4JIS9_DROKI|nr:myosin heavy chain IB [Drosophila kikkawai]
MWKYLLGCLALFAAATSCLGLVAPESLLEESSLEAELDRRTRQQQIVQEVIVENNFGGPGFGGPGFGGPGFGGPGFRGPGFGGPGFGGPGFGGPGFGGPGFGGPGFGGPGFGRGKFGFARSYDEEEEPAAQYGTSSGIPAPPCPNTYLFSCGAVITPVPCGSSGSSPCGGY